jgi:hypothetical protein
MTSVELRIGQRIVQECKKYIEENNLDCLQEIYKSITLDSDQFQNLDWPVIFHKLYLHACLKRKREVAEWFEKTLYPKMDPIQQIALKQIFPYGKHLLGKKP